MRTDTRSVMLSKFKVKSVGGGSFQTHFYHNREQSCALVPTQPSLIEVYEAEIRRLREENRNLKIQHNTMANQLNEVLAQLQQANAEKLLQKQRIIETKNVFYNTKKDFWQLTPAARNNKKRKVRQLAFMSIELISNDVICKFYTQQVGNIYIATGMIKILMEKIRIICFEEWLRCDCFQAFREANV